MLQHELGRLVEAEIVYQRGVPPQATYTFKHALIQDAAYESLLKSTRQQYHQRIAQVLEAQFPETAETQPELLAQHYTEARLPEQAIRYWQRAGQRALQGSAYTEAVAHLRQGLAAYLATGSKAFQPLGLQPLVEAYGAGGHPDEGLHALAEALAVIETRGLPYYGAELHRLKGALLLQQAVPDAAQAAACFQQALAVARRQQARSWELRAAMSLARLWQSQDKRQEAYALLAPVYGWFTEGFDTADLQEAKALLEALA